jgi:antitoxin HicB
MSEAIDLTYYAHLEKEENNYLVTFRDFDNIFTEGDTLGEALSMAQEALDGVLMEMAKGNYDIPLPSGKQANDYPIPVSPEVTAPILLHILRNKRHKTMTEVAELMHVPYQQYQRLEHNCNMTLKSLKRAAAAMGGRVEIKLYMDNEHLATPSQ